MKYNGIDPCELYPGLSIASETPPATVRTNIETMGGGEEGPVMGRTIQHGEYTVRINIAGRAAMEAREITRILSAWARPLALSTCELVPSWDPSIAYDAMCKDISLARRSNRVWIVSIVFSLPRPIAYNRRATTANTGGTAGALNINVGGSSYIRPVIRAKASAAASDMVLYVDEKSYVRIVTPIKSGDVLAVYADGRLELTEASTGAVRDVTDKVDYVVTDLQAMQEALTPGKHTISAVPASALDMEWRCEWV